MHKKLSLLKRGHNQHTSSVESIEDTHSSRNLLQPNSALVGRTSGTVGPGYKNSSESPTNYLTQSVTPVGQSHHVAITNQQVNNSLLNPANNI